MDHKSHIKTLESVIISSKGMRCLVAFAIMVLFFLPYAWMEPFSSDTNDDTALNLIAAGAFGEKSQYLYYCNVLYGYLLKSLFLIAPSINWYLWCALALNAFSVAMLGTVLAYFLEYRWLFPALIVLHFYIAGEFYQSIQFTRNAYLYAICGVVLLIMGSIIASYRRTVSAIGGFLIFVSFLVRKECLIPLVPFCFLMLLRQSFMNKKKVALPLVILMVAGAFCGVATIADHYLFRVQVEWKDYNSYHYEGIIPILDDDMRRGYSMDINGSGLNANDLMLLNEYHYADRDYFSLDRLKSLQADKEAISSWNVFGEIPGIIREINGFPQIPDYVYITPGTHSKLNVMERSLNWNVCLVAALLIYAGYLIAKKRIEKKQLLWILLLLGSVFLDLFAIIYGTGHMPRRATIGPRMCFELFSAIVLFTSETKRKTGAEEGIQRRYLLVPIFALLLIICIRFLNWKNVPEHTETELVLAELRNIEGESYILDGMLLWGDRLGISDLRQVNRKNYENYFRNFILSGGWVAEVDQATHWLREKGITDPMVRMNTDSHFHYVVARWRAQRMVPLMADYLSRRNGVEVTPRIRYAGNDIMIIDFLK